MAKMVEKRRTKVDLAFPTVVITNSKRRRRKWSYYRLAALVLLLLLFLVHFIDRTMLRLPVAEKRLSLAHVTSIADLSLDRVDSWCLQEVRGGKGLKLVSNFSPHHVDIFIQNEHDTCTCTNPLIPEGRQEDNRWETVCGKLCMRARWQKSNSFSFSLSVLVCRQVHHLNRENFKARNPEELDVVFLGDSITEGWTGKFYGEPDKRVEGAFAVFNSLFSKYYGGRYEALAQGISADTTSNLLWRIQNGEIGQSFGTSTTSVDDEEEEEEEDGEEEAAPTTTSSPPIFWVLIGTNDLGNLGCSGDMVLLGVVRIVEEIRLQQPTATVVINGLLPRTSDHGGLLLQNRGKKPALWPIIQSINTELKRYATQRDQVEYFESNAFFHNASLAKGEHRIDQKLMYVCLG